MQRQPHAPAPGTAPARRILRRAEVTMKTGLSNTSIFRAIQRGEFPAAVPLGRRAVGWFEHEVDAWLESRGNARTSGGNG